MTEPAHPNQDATDAPPDAMKRLEEDLEKEHRAVLGRRTSEFGALVAGTRLALRTAATGLPVAIGYALVNGLVSYEVLQLAIGARDAAPAMLQLWSQIAFGIGGFASLYAVLQFAKRDQVTRASWWPTLFAIPMLLVGLGFVVVQSEQARQLGPVILSLFLMAWGLVWMSFGGAAAAIVWIRAGKAALDGRSVGAAELTSEVQTRMLDVAAPHGARIHAQTIGMQLLLPGIFYALQLAFTDMVAVLDPEQASLRRSGQLTFGMRGRLFRMMLVWWVLGTVLSMAIAMPLEGVYTMDLAIQKAQELFLDPSAPSRLTYVAQELVWAGFTWVLTLSLLVLYLEREAQVRAKRALKDLKKKAAG